MRPMRVGVVGCGTISDIYLENLSRWQAVQVLRCADLLPERARSAARRHGVPRAGTVTDLLADLDVELVVNLTIPAAHGEVSLAAVAAGKHVYSEKPLATSGADARKLLDAARRQGVRVGGAPDTFLGAGGQTCRGLIDEGAIGTPLAAAAFMLGSGHESWHPAADFYYQPGGGPLFDMGPYHLTALVNLLGPVAGVSAVATKGFPHRVALDGHLIPVEVATHVVAILEFGSGATAHVAFSFDVTATTIPYGIEVYGTAGSIALGDPNTFGGPVLLHQRDGEGWADVPLCSSWTGDERGLGVAEMAEAIETGREHRAHGDLMQHVLTMMEGILLAAERGCRIAIESSCSRPDPFTALALT
jgi:predicted dehydrogenase